MTTLEGGVKMKKLLIVGGAATGSAFLAERLLELRWTRLRAVSRADARERSAQSGFSETSPRSGKTRSASWNCSNARAGPPGVRRGPVPPRAMLTGDDVVTSPRVQNRRAGCVQFLGRIPSTMKTTVRFSIALLVSTLVVPASADALSLQEVGNFDAPTYVTSHPSDSNRLFIVEQAGVIRLIDSGSTTEFLNIDPIVESGGERGLLSMAFAPDYESSGLFYVFYTSSNDPGTGEDETGDLKITEFDSDESPIESTRRVVLTIEHSAQANHNGGQLQFGPDGYLYASTGDGGGAGDPDGDAQNTASLLGKILRIDPEGASPGEYTIPASNPFVGTGGADEIWSYGLRNPWRFSFDRLTGALTIGDVGQGSWEEIDYDPGPGPGRDDNFGWNCREGMHDFSTAPPCDDPPAFTEPVFEYANDSSTCAITGGYVVRDLGLGDLYARYVYADYCAGELRSLNLGLPTADDDRSEGLSVPFVTSFGEDADCRLYVVSQNGPVYRLTEPNTAAPVGCPQPPAPSPPLSEPLPSNDFSFGRLKGIRRGGPQSSL
jgi:glucose/arabinose dehydrogenase